MHVCYERGARRAHDLDVAKMVYAISNLAPKKEYLPSVGHQLESLSNSLYELQGLEL